MPSPPTAYIKRAMCHDYNIGVHKVLKITLWAMCLVWFKNLNNSITTFWHSTHYWFPVLICILNIGTIKQFFKQDKTPNHAIKSVQTFMHSWIINSFRLLQRWVTMKLPLLVKLSEYSSDMITKLHDYSILYIRHGLCNI